MTLVLPVVTEQTRETLEQVVTKDEATWKRRMVQHIKQDNPEINSLLLNFAQKFDDPKSIILAGYIVYAALDLAAQEEDEALENP